MNYLIYIFIVVQAINHLKLDGYGIQENMIEMINNNQLECNTIETIIQRGFGQLILDFIDDLTLIEQEHIRCAEKYINEDIQQQQKLLKMIRKEEQNSINMTPILFWAQSRNHLLLKVKFSHRIDAPAYLNVKNHYVNSNETNLIISADSLLQDKMTHFLISLIYFNSIVKDQENYWKLESVGTMVLNLTKSSQQLWPHLTKNKQEKYQIWWDIKSQIGKDMDDFSKMLEQLEDDKSNKKKNKKIIKTKEEDNFVRKIQQQISRIYEWLFN